MNLEKSRKVKLLQAAFGQGVIESNEVNLLLRCPVCKDRREEKKKLFVRLEDGWFNCWVCGFSGKNISKLFYKHARNYVDQCNEVFGIEKKKVIQVPQEEIVELPEDACLAVEKKNDPDAREVVKYLRDRGLTTLDMYRWRICVSSKREFRRKAIFPSFDATGKLNYYTARAIDDVKFKYTNSKASKTKIIFNEMDLDWTQPIFLVEGVFDAVKCPDNTAIALGSTLSRQSELFKKLYFHKSTVVVAFDSDAEDKAHSVCRTLSSAGCQVYKVTVYGEDLGSRTKEDVNKILSSAKLWSTMDILTNKISKIRSGSIL